MLIYNLYKNYDFSFFKLIINSFEGFTMWCPLDHLTELSKFHHPRGAPDDNLRSVESFVGSEGIQKVKRNLLTMFF